jgi:two-component system phosphate regulon sensor histidine kinase PhoR
MRLNGTGRALAGIGIAALGVILALVAGAPLAAALLASLGGGLAVALTWPSVDPSYAPEQPLGAPDPSPFPGAAELLEAFDEPLLLVRNRRVLLANSAAQSVLGNHIQGIDVRLAIRHPAAAALLIDPETEDAPEGVTRTELTGPGDPDRQWEMIATSMGDNIRLVHLVDRSQAHASEQMRTDFVANASHELRTPLATLLGFLETLQDEAAAADKPLRTRFLGIMFDEAKRMHRLVDDLISLSRIEAERFSLPREPVRLLPLVEEVRTSCAQLIEERESDVIVESRDGEPVVLGDRSQLLQLLQNLIVNALKYGGSRHPVTVRFEPAGQDMLQLSVIDRGDGIAAEHIPRLTERFYRVDASRSRAIGGTGLGLAIVKHIVGRHRGRLDIRSKIGEGTEVNVHLPRAPEEVSSKSHGSVTESTRNLSSGVANPD